MLKDEEIEMELDEVLDGSGNHRLFVRYGHSPDYCVVNWFVVIYFAKLGDHVEEIVKYDGKLGEAVHVHRLYVHPPVKRYLSKPLAWGTIEECILAIRENWVDHYLSYLKKKEL